MSKNLKGVIKPSYILFLKKKHQLKIFFRRKKNSFLINKNINNGVFPVEIISSMGLFANMTYAIRIINYCEEKKLVPYLKFTLENSQKEGNPFDYLFNVISKKKATKKIRYLKMKSFTDLSLNVDWENYQPKSILSASNLMKNNIIIKDFVLEKVDAFYKKNLINKKVLGLHYRSTDKFSEAKILSYNYVVKNINYYIEKYPETDAVFISTDDINFVNHIKTNFNLRTTIFNQDSFRSNNNVSIHLSGQNIFEINFDALINCLLLSKCTTLMKTASNLSAWSKIFNPNINVIILSKPKERFNFFPEKDVAEDVLYSPII